MTDEEIYEKLNQIDDLKDRVLLKSILNGVFVNLKEESEKKFSLLEKRCLMRFNMKVRNIKYLQLL